ncbi:hypothetical protein BD769DRAFT_1669019 [Suillus cothurnatus]|nr:hypothetical protein BD769DRAFT_1669019 [Suillus cothurnatus]
MSHYAPFSTTQLSWIEDMMAHVQADYSTISPPPSSLENFPTPPSSPIGSPSTQLLMQLGDTDVSHEIKISISATDSTNEKKRSHTSCTCHHGAILEQLQNFNLSNDNIVDTRIGQPEEQKENKSTQAEASRIGSGVIQARAFCPTFACQTYKRKIEDIGTNTDQENFDISLNPAPVSYPRSWTYRIVGLWTNP